MEWILWWNSKTRKNVLDFGLNFARKNYNFQRGIIESCFLVQDIHKFTYVKRIFHAFDKKEILSKSNNTYKIVEWLRIFNPTKKLVDILFTHKKTQKHRRSKRGKIIEWGKMFSLHNDSLVFKKIWDFHFSGKKVYVKHVNLLLFLLHLVWNFF